MDLRFILSLYNPTGFFYLTKRYLFTSFVVAVIVTLDLSH